MFRMPNLLAVLHHDRHPTCNQGLAGRATSLPHQTRSQRQLCDSDRKPLSGLVGYTVYKVFVVAVGSLIFPSFASLLSSSTSVLHILFSFKLLFMDKYLQYLDTLYSTDHRWVTAAQCIYRSQSAKVMYVATLRTVNLMTKYIKNGSSGDRQTANSSIDRLRCRQLRPCEAQRDTLCFSGYM